jgi:HEAT repeat protein
MSNLLELWQEAESQGDWVLLNHYLQQALLSNQVDHLLEEIGVDRCLKMAIAVLSQGDFQDRWDVAKVFPALGEAAVPVLIELVRNDGAEFETRWFAARLLGEFQTEASLEALIELLHQSEDEELRAMAAKALAYRGEAAICHLTPLLSNSNTRPLAVRCLVQMPTPGVIDPLLSVASDPQPELRRLAIDALSNFDDPRGLTVLLNGLTDPVAATRQTAITGLGRWMQAQVDLDLVKHLSERLFDLDLEVCRRAAIVLAKSGTDDAAAALFRVLASNHTPLPLRLECARSLGWTASAAALNYLRQALVTQPEPQLSQEIIQILGRWRNPQLKPEAVQVLLQVLTDYWTSPDPEIQQAIALALGCLGEKSAIDPLIQLLTQEHEGVRLHAIAALKQLDVSLAHQRLEALAHREALPEELRRGVEIALQEWNQSPYPDENLA